MLAEILKDRLPVRVRSPRLPWPDARDRAAWQGLGERLAVLHVAQSAFARDWPLLRAAQYMAFARSGDRVVYETPYFERRRMLIRLALGEAAEREGRFIDRIVDGLWLLAEETSWVVPAHSAPRPLPGEGHPALPDVDAPEVDLFAAQTAATASLCCWLLQDALNAASPRVILRIRGEVYARVLAPFLTRDDFWWMGVTRTDLNNWTPWIVSNILICLLAWEEDDAALSAGLFKSAVILDRYFACVPQDGALDEGVSYWNVAGASLLDCLELLEHAAGSMDEVYRDPKIRAFARFPLHAHISGKWFLNFADCDALPWLDGERVARFGARTGDKALRALGDELLSLYPFPDGMDTPQMSRTLWRLFMDKAISPEQFPPPGFLAMPGAGVWIKRCGRLYAAVKGGHNGENHNHNDLGGFVLYIDGSPEIIDAGNMTYTRQTFSDGRYALFNTRSMNHNVPLIGGHEQAAGREHGAEVSRLDEGGAAYELQSAYPEEAGLLSFRRSACMNGAFIMEDAIRLERACEITWVFMLRNKPMLTTGVCFAGKMRLSFPVSLVSNVDEIPVNDARLAKNWPGSIYRMTLTAPAAAVFDVRFRMTAAD